MFRKLALGLVAATALATAALSPTAASAHGWHHHGGHHGYGFGYGLGFTPVYVGGGYDDCLQRRRIMTRHGYRWRTVNVCY
jgi:opacity protein-like surface antigen